MKFGHNGGVMATLAVWQEHCNKFWPSFHAIPVFLSHNIQAYSMTGGSLFKLTWFLSVLTVSSENNFPPEYVYNC